MDRQKSFSNDDAKLYLVATPIGNLEDMTFRAVNTLKEVGVIFAEDTRVTRVLLNHYNIKNKLEIYQEFNKETSYKKIVEYLKNGINVALVSDAGMPVISDPGFFASKMALQEGFSVVPIPGVSACLTALIVSNIAPNHFMFYGFLDNKTTKRIKELQSIKDNTNTIIFYESPHRIKESLIDMLSVFGNRNIALCRELTKKFEEIIRGNIEDVIEVCDDLKGEMVIVVEGCNTVIDYNEIDKFEQINELILAGKRKNEAIGIVAKRLGVERQELYKEYSNKED
ncbi:MAG: 16S rRNA (cytidine(1402)-2'-O)-methyltransferase [bacterium]